MMLSDRTRMKWADKYAIEKLGIPSLVLMERAAEQLFSQAKKMLGTFDGRTIVVFCGSGNNGGDGFAVARLLIEAGASVSVFHIGAREKMTSDCAEMERRLPVSAKSIGCDIEKVLDECELVIDAIFGIGLNSPLREAAADASDAINNCCAPVLSADVPSGVNADTGQIMGTAVKADVTVTFSLGKPGLYSQPGCAYCGRVVVADIGIPENVLERSACNVSLICAQDIDAIFPKRDALGHKGSFGKALLICGSVGYTGAAWLSSEMAVRSGAGLIRLACFEEIYPILAGKCVESMPFPIKNGFSDIAKHLSGSESCLVGCGLGQDSRAEDLLKGVLDACTCPLVIDADGINLISRNIDLLKTAACPVVLTPHEGEFLRLGGDLSGGRIAGATQLAGRTGAVIVLKGHRTVVAAPSGQCWINLSGNSGLAKGGSGDVLAGLLAGFLAQGIDTVDAARAAVWIHGSAGDLCAAEIGQYGMTPTDVMCGVCAIMKKY